MKQLSFKFGPFRLDAAEERLRRDGKPVPLPPKAFDTLLYLIQHCPHLVTREELIQAVWPGSFVEDGSLSVSISLVRRTLGLAEDGAPYIETVPRKGYRFRCEVVAVEENAIAPPLLAPASSEPPPLSRSFTPRRTASGPIFSGIALAALLALALSAAWAIYSARKPKSGPPPFTSMSISRLTSGGDVSDAALSPDGKYVAYFLNEREGQSLWIRQVNAPGTVRIAAPEPVEHSGLTFTPDGNYLYYIKKTEDGLGALYRVPALGGDTAKILPGIRGHISFSPDGKQIAFIRIDPAHWAAVLMVAQQDGTALRQIVARKRPDYLSGNGLAWSPDGRSIFCFGGNAAGYVGQAFRLLELRVADGKEKIVSSHTWAWAGPVVNARNSAALLVSASERAEDAHQIWRVSLVDGAVSKVTNDLSNYATLSLADDGKTLAAVQTTRPSQIWDARFDDLNRPVRVLTGNIPELNSLTWTPDGEIAYSARLGDDLSLFSVTPDGHAPKQLSGAEGDKTGLAITPDNRYLVYQREGKIWRMNRDGTNLRQLTRGAHDVHPEPAAGGQWLIYASFANWSPSIGGKPTLWTVPIGGGEPRQLSDVAASLPQLSPDGQFVAAAYFPGEDPRYSPNGIAIFSVAGGKPVRLFARPGAASDLVHWSPDGKGIDYIRNSNGAANIWRQPLDGSAACQVTHFTSDDLFDFAWSRDGRQLALARGNILSDVVLIKSSE